MKLSAKAEYACLAVLELALRHDRTEPVRLVEIAGPNAIPERFLVQILLQLKGAGYVTSARGAAGGYRLAMEPREISVCDIVQIVEGPTASTVAEQEANSSPGWRVLRFTNWEIYKHLYEVLEAICRHAPPPSRRSQATGETPPP